MPDRAVVDDELPPLNISVKPHLHSWSDDYSECLICGAAPEIPPEDVVPWEYGVPIDAGMPEPQPRALVALSEDRQWLVVLSPLGDKWIGMRWHCFGEYYRNRVKSQPPYEIEDTGQDAHEVLDAWLAERGQ